MKSKLLFRLLTLIGIGVIEVGLASSIFAGGVQTLETVEVTDSAENLVGSADSATEGTVTARQIEERPFTRTGELLETIPGVVITQHSGEGKANQYYLRGFQLDHGTDFATFVCGMPVNLPTHAHGQGWNDPNFVIPEVISGIQYMKGPYYVENGDFSAAGAGYMRCADVLSKSVLKVEYGTDGYRRFLVAGSTPVGSGNLLYALEAYHIDGPWTNPDDYRKFNGWLRYSRDWAENHLAVTLMGYHGTWNSTDQIAQRAIGTTQCRPAGGCTFIDRFGTLDPSDGATSYRYSATAEWERTTKSSVTKANAYLSDYYLNMYSNFTYFLSHPEPPFGDGTGDQFNQTDRRIITGINASQAWITNVGDHEMVNTIGIQARNDNIPIVALRHSQNRVVLDTFSQDHVVQTSAALYFQNQFQWIEKFRTVVGIREDFYRWNVIANLPENSGTATQSIASPKLTMIFGPWAKTEYYINAGYGFHSNDGRGTTQTISIDQVTLERTPQEKVNGLVRAKGAEIGARTAIVPHLQSELTVWMLNLDSELTFNADKSGTDAGPPSHRRGVEWANYYTPTQWLTIDADYAYSWSFYANASEPPFNLPGHYIPESPRGVLSAGASVYNLAGFMGSLRVRYFGKRPLIEDDSVESASSTVVNARVGYEFLKMWSLTVDVFNVLNAKVQDIQYFYASRLIGEPLAGVSGIHLKQEFPREVRVALAAKF